MGYMLFTVGGAAIAVSIFLAVTIVLAILAVAVVIAVFLLFISSPLMTVHKLGKRLLFCSSLMSW